MIDTFAIRCSILHLAFSGKLTEQIDTDGTAADILGRISTSKNIAQTENVPYEIPDSWAWVRLSDLYKINPKVDAEGEAIAAFIPMERISGGFGRDFTYETQKWEQASKNHTKFEDGDVAFAKITPCFENRKSFIAHDLPNGIGGGTTELIILRQKEMLTEYTYYLVLDQRFINTGTASYKGTVGQQRVQSDVIKNYLIPVPPYAEQQRIVNIIKQAFSIIDSIDELQTLYSENLAALKNKLIDTALRGKLTEQLPEDGTSEDLYRQIQAEKRALIETGKFKKDKAFSEITGNETPFEIPDNWKWVRIGEVVCFNPKHTSLNDEMVVSFVPMTNVFDGYNNQFSYDEKKWKDVKTGYTNFCDGDLGVAKITPCFQNRKSVVFHNLLNGIGAGTTELTIMRPIGSFVHPEYLLWFCKSGDFIKNGVESFNGSVGQARVNKDYMKTCLLPLPPLAEQQRIVDKLDTVFKEIKACE